MTDLPIELEAFLGDDRYTFKLTAPLIRELERTTGCGIGALFKRVAVDRTYFHNDLSELIRLGLIGGGVAPKRAKEMIEAYVDGQAIGGTFSIALPLLEAVYFGKQPKPVNPHRSMKQDEARNIPDTPVPAPGTYADAINSEIEKVNANA